MSVSKLGSRHCVSCPSLSLQSTTPPLSITPKEQTDVPRQQNCTHTLAPLLPSPVFPSQPSRAADPQGPVPTNVCPRARTCGRWRSARLRWAWWPATLRTRRRLAWRRRLRHSWRPCTSRTCSRWRYGQNQVLRRRGLTRSRRWGGVRASVHAHTRTRTCEMERERLQQGEGGEGRIARVRVGSGLAGGMCEGP